MINTIILALSLFIAGSFDELPFFVAIFSEIKNKKDYHKVIWGFTIGHTLLVLISIFFAKILNYIPNSNLIGLSGLIPIVLGMIILFRKRDKLSKDIIKVISVFQIIVITLSMGGDDISVYVPLFLTMDNIKILIVLLIFTIGTRLQLIITWKLTQFKKINKFTKKHIKLVVGIVFILSGVYILYENGTIKWIIEIMERMFL